MKSTKLSVELVFDDGDPRAERTDLEPVVSLILSHAIDLIGVEVRVGGGTYVKEGTLFCQTCGTALGDAEEDHDALAEALEAGEPVEFGAG